MKRQTYFDWDTVSPVVQERIRIGEAAMERIDQHVTFHDWYEVGLTCLDVQNEAMRLAGTNRHIGKGYNAACAMLWKHAPRVGALDGATRKHAVWMARNWEAVEQGENPDGPGVEIWHAELEVHQRRLINHPATVFRRYRDKYPKPTEQEEDKRKPDIYAADDDEIEEEGEEDNGETTTGSHGKSREPEPGIAYTEDDWLAELEEVWDRGAPAWQTKFLNTAQPNRVSPATFDDAEEEIAAAVDKVRSAEVNADARRDAAIKLPGTPSNETIGVAVHHAAEYVAAVQSGEQEPLPADFPADDFDRSTERLSKAEFLAKLAESEERLGKDAVAAVKKAHRNGRYRTDWMAILTALSKL